MEEVKENNKHIFRYIAIAIYVLAAILIISGIVTMVSGAKDTFNNRPSINSEINNSYQNGFDDDFFEDFEKDFDEFDDEFDDNFERTSKSMFKSFSLIATGAILIFVASVFLIIDFHKNKTFQNLGKSMIDGLMDTVAYTKTAYEERVVNKTKPKPYYCEYCDSLIEESDSKCQSCGATRRQKD